MLDVIITTYNRVELLKRTMNSFFINTDLKLVDKIIISNDGSCDGTKDYLTELCNQFNNITVLPDQDRRLGLIPRFNKAFELTTANMICEFQDDVEFSKDWLSKLLRYKDVRCDFITGYDAKEHTSFGGINGYKVKHSSRFTQLLASRETWGKYFPMKPDHSYPTPCNKNGKNIGSNIDMKLFGMRKNNRRGKTRFLVIPDLIRHNAERYNSTWRNPISMNPDGKTVYQGGLNIDSAKAYWANRYESQKDIAVGYAGRPVVEQDKILSQKKVFILPKIDTNMRVIDYGCGVGKYSQEFNKDKYLGVDLTKSFLDIAKQSNPGYKYRLIDQPFTFDIGKDFHMFLTINVLQHNCDYITGEIFRRLKEIKPTGFTICLYENTHNFSSTNHMCFRRPEDYLSFVSEHYHIVKSEVHSHKVHGEEHSLIKVVV